MTENTDTPTTTEETPSAVSQLGDNPSDAEQAAALVADGVITEEQAQEALASSGATASEDGVKADEAGDPNRPDFLREEFKTPEDQARAYNDLVKLLGKQGKVDENGKPIEAGIPKKSEGEGEGDGESGSTETIGRDQLHAWSDEFAANGKLGDDTYGRLEKAGFDRETVDLIAASLQTADSVGKAGAIQEAGIDPANFQTMTEWAAEEWSEAEIDAFNEAYLGADAGRRLLALKSLKNDYAAANGQGQGGTGSGVIEGEGGNGNTLQPFRSEAELLEAQRAKDDRGRYRYDTDPAYRASVDKRAALALQG